MVTHRYTLVEKSANKKTGKIAVARSSMSTCPDSCPHKQANTCYAGLGPMSISWKKMGTEGDTKSLDLWAFCDRLRGLKRPGTLRLWDAGDWPGEGARLNRQACLEIAMACSGLRTWSYTAYHDIGINMYNIKDIESTGVVVNRSGTLVDVHRRISYDVASHRKYMATVPLSAPHKFSVKGVKYRVCQAQTVEGVTCKTCGGHGMPWCLRPDRDFVVCVYPHGTFTKKLNAHIEDQIRVGPEALAQAVGVSQDAPSLRLRLEGTASKTGR